MLKKEKYQLIKFLAGQVTKLQQQQTIQVISATLAFFS
jgi:hypothetical protein